MRIDIAQLEFIDLTLRKILTEIERVTGIEFTVTSLYRIDDDGVHGTLPLRGTDLRCRSKAVGEFLRDWINARWIYDPARPSRDVCIFHDTGSGYHLHIHVHPATVIRP